VGVEFDADETPEKTLKSLGHRQGGTIEVIAVRKKDDSKEEVVDELD